MTVPFEELYQRMTAGEEIEDIVASLIALTPARRSQLKLRLQQYQNEDLLWRDRGLQEVSSLSTRCLRALVSNRRESESWLEAISRLGSEGVRNVGPALRAELTRVYEIVQTRLKAERTNDTKEG